MDASSWDGAVLFDDLVQADLKRQVSAGAARTPDVTAFWPALDGLGGGFPGTKGLSGLGLPGDEGAGEAHHGAGGADGGGSSGGAETPKGHWIAAKVDVNELYSKLSNIQEQQQAQKKRAAVKVDVDELYSKLNNIQEQRPAQREDAAVKVLGGGKAPLPVGLVLREPRLAPVRAPPPPRGAAVATAATGPHPPGEQPPSPVVPPPPRPPPGLSRPQRAPRPRAAAAAPPGFGAAAAAAPAHKAPVVSIGTVGHPAKCAEPCLEEFCGKGLACPKCHLCGAARIAAVATAAAAAAAASAGAAGGNRGEGEPGCPSVGSMGHPKQCAEACKFHSKGKGCKDGANCVRCHICRWSRHGNKKR